MAARNRNRSGSKLGSSLHHSRFAWRVVVARLATAVSNFGRLGSLGAHGLSPAWVQVPIAISGTKRFSQRSAEQKEER
jgi:hypothetical protein